MNRELAFFPPSLATFSDHNKRYIFELIKELPKGVDKIKDTQKIKLKSFCWRMYKFFDAVRFEMDWNELDCSLSCRFQALSLKPSPIFLPNF